MKLLLGCLLLAFLVAKRVESTAPVPDEVCVQKQQAGVRLGTVFDVPETCEKCACDGSLRKFCMVDPLCKQDQEAKNRRPCYRGGSKFEHASQVQVDCNICTCNNATWDCTTEECYYGGGGSQKEEEKAKEEVQEEVQEEDSSCQDLDDRCAKWVKRQGKEVCETKKYIKKKCIKSCDRCAVEEEKAVVEEKPIKKKEEPCKDKNDNCAVWAKREGDLCTNHKFMIAKCKLTCNLCEPEPEVAKEVESEVTEEEVEEGPREKTEWELEEERRQAEIDAWRDRLIAEGELVDLSKTPQGCLFDCGGTLYPWGSTLQDSYCGVCTCKRKKKHNYFFKCTNPECETNPTCH